MTKLLSALAGILMLAASTNAVAEDYSFDPTHTRIMYAVNHFGFSNVHGEFLGFEGVVNFDPTNVEAAQFDITIEVASVSSGYTTRDEHMRGSNWFSAEEFPTMHFVSTSIEQTGEGTAIMTGDLTLKGVTLPVALDVILNGQGRHPFNAQRQIYGFTATGSLNRSDFGMEYAIPFLGDEITLTIEAELFTDIPE